MFEGRWIKVEFSAFLFAFIPNGVTTMVGLVIVGVTVVAVAVVVMVDVVVVVTVDDGVCSLISILFVPDF